MTQAKLDSLKQITRADTIPFRYEIDLVNSALKFLHSTNKGEYLIYNEFEAGFGRPDIVLCSSLTNDAFGGIKALEKINPRLAPLLTTKVARNISSYKELARACGISEKNAKRIAAALASNDLLEFKSGLKNSFRIQSIKTPPFKYVVSIEAKLRDWKRALTQAYRYKTFSNQSWVLLDEAHILPALKSTNSFKNFGVGLASFSSQGELRIYVQARTAANASSTTLSWRTQALLSKMIGAVRTDPQP